MLYELPGQSVSVLDPGDYIGPSTAVADLSIGNTYT